MTTADEVAVMQIELADMSPELEAAVEEAKLTMKKIAKDTVSNPVKSVVDVRPH